MTDGRSYEDEEEFGLVYQDENKEELSELPEEKRISIEDGFWLTRNRYGYLNLDYWASLTGYTVDQLLTLAKGKLIWRDPARFELSGGNKYAGWLPKEQFLMGNRIKKLKDAERLNISYGIFEEEIRLLKENLPDEVSGEDIHVNLGSTWVLSVDGFIAGFIAELLEMRTVPKVIYDAYRGRWSIESNDEPNYVLNNYTYGTVFMSALRIIEHKLNARPLKIYDQVPRLDGRGNDSVLNQADTLAAQEKGKLIDARFQDYCHGNKRNEELLQEAFMNQYGYGLCEFDGSHFNFKDISGKISMFKNQKDAVAHALASPNVLFADKVGSGKTIEYACSVHELLRMGLVKKALIVVPNTTLDAVYKVYTDLFPMDSVLLVRLGKEFSAARRKDTLAKMKTAGYQVIFMAYSSFDMITMTKEYAFAKKDRELRQCRIQMENAPTYQQKRKLENMFRRMQKSAKKYRQEFINSETACFDELGFDMIVVDEAHNYKNISLEYRGDNIVGFHAVGSKKADNMLEKVQYIQKQRGRVIFATGTPITNSLADLYVLQRYLQPEELKICNIYHFNDWINTFCEEETAFEIDVDSKNCRFTTRFSRFHNLTELMCMFSEVCHFYQGSAEELGLPEFNGYSNVTVKRSKEQKAYIDALADRTEAIRNHELEHARINQRQKKKELISLEEILFHMPARLAGKRLLIANVQSDIRYYQKHKESVKREERLSFGEELLLALKENVMQEKERYFTEYQGFDVILPRHMEVDKPYVWLKRKGSNQYSVAMNTDKVLGVCQRLDYLLDNLQKELNRHNNKLRALLKQQNQARSDIALGNMYDEEVKVLADKLKEIDEKLKEGKAI